MIELINSIIDDVGKMRIRAGADPAGRPDFSHGVQMDSKPLPSSKSGIFLQGKTAFWEKVFLHGRPCKKSFAEKANFP